MKLRERKGLSQETVQVIILGAGGRDFHDFNTFLRRKIRIGQPIARVKYDFDIDLEPVIEDFLRGKINLRLTLSFAYDNHLKLMMKF